MLRFCKRFIPGVGMLALTVLLAGDLYAGTVGKIAGRVIDKETGEPLPGVNVILEGTTLGAATDVNGRYFILKVPPGEYTLTSRFIGYQTVSVEKVRVNIDLTTTVNFQLSSEVVELGETAVVIADRPLIQKDGVTTMQVVEAEVVQNMVADDFKDVLTLNSGVTTQSIRPATAAGEENSGEADFFVRGGRGNETAFMIDGMYARDGVTNRFGTEVSNSAVEELQLISGNFNAEYGNAMSGVLNLITKEGGSRTTFRVRGFTDAVFGSSTSDWNFEQRDRELKQNGVLNRSNWGTYQGEVSVGGSLPGFGNKLRYFLAAEHFETDGYIGVMQGEKTNLGTAKLTFAPTNTSKFNFSVHFNNKDTQIYDHDYAPDGDFFHLVARDSSRDNNRQGNNRQELDTFQGIFGWTQSLGANAFFDAKLQYFKRDFFDGIFDAEGNRVDPVNFSVARFDPAEDWVVSGDDNAFLDQQEKVFEGRVDLTWQANVNHSIKTGVDLQFHNVNRREVLAFEGEVSTLRVDDQDYDPVIAGAYLQDKMEFNDLVINAGVRLDYFDTADSVVKDFNDPLGELVPSKSTAKVSPRLGIAHPVTDRASLHFSYGHFYQYPEFNKLINNRRRFIDIFRPTLGNPNLKPQKTIAFEVGWDQQITDYLAVSVTGFYKDIENLVSTDVFQNARPSVTTYFINQDFANSRGVEINFRTRRYKHLATYFSYTISRAEGNSSNPRDLRQDLFARPPREPIKALILMDWDRPHVFNFNIDYRYGKGEGPRFLENVGINLTGRFQSGFPYTPTDSRGQRIADENSARTPGNFQLDLRVDKLLSFGSTRLGLFTEITNLTNHRNVINVFTSTGQADISADPDTSPERARNPLNIGPQRNIRIGFELYR